MEFREYVKKAKAKAKSKSKENALTKTELLMCPRFEDPIGDDIDEVEPPLGWKELSRDEKLEILDYEMDLYWNQLTGPINWWKISTYLLAFSNAMLLFSFI